jgi:hypothetical protein
MKTPYTVNQYDANKLETSCTRCPLFSRLLKETERITLQENKRQRLERLMRRMVSIEFSMPPKAAIDRYEISPSYREIE